MKGRRRRQRILLTGFGPFPGVPVNASGELVNRLAVAMRGRYPEHHVTAEILPTEWEAAPRRLADLLDAARPTIALHFGVSRTAEGFVIEAEARNIAGAVADARGALPASECVVGGGAKQMIATLPAEPIVAGLRAAGIPACSSRDAGSYLCNTVFYHSLRHVRAAPVARLVGFIHIPAELGRCAHQTSQSAGQSLSANGDGANPPRVLNWSAAVEGGLMIVAACLDERAVACPTQGSRRDARQPVKRLP